MEERLNEQVSPNTLDLHNISPEVNLSAIIALKQGWEKTRK